MSDAIERTVAEGGSQAAPAAGHEITRQQERYAVPPVDIYEKEDALTVIADLPGVSANGLLVHVEQGVLTISGKVDVDSSVDLLRQSSSSSPRSTASSESRKPSTPRRSGPR